MANVKITDLYDLSHTLASEYLAGYTYPWEALAGIKDLILEIGETLDPELYEKRGEDVWISKSAKIFPNNYIAGPCIIGHNTEVRPGAFIRGNVLVGDGAVIGNSTELKNAIIFDNAQLPHYNYVGDSIIGYKAHMSAGAIASNLRLDKEKIYVNGVATGLTKFGLCLGDHAEVGCSAVLCPGSIIGKRTLIYPLVMVKGVLPAEKVYDGHTLKDRRPDNGTAFWN
jgi:NDP-sugar pyrophosphorylase family protein